MHLKKSKGQHLLTDKNMLSRIVREAAVSPDDNILEIGAGTGLLTGILAQSACRVVSLEIEKNFEEILREIEKQHHNLKIIIGDFLNFDMAGFFAHEGGKWRIVANIPYNITSPIIEKIIQEARSFIIDVHLLLQKEVARRITASPGTDDYGKLSVFTQFFFESEILFIVPPEVFIPPPKVDSALLRMSVRKDIPPVNPRIFFTLVGAAFAQRRKQLRNALKNALPGLKGEKLDQALQSAGINSKQRGETLSLDEFAGLTRKVIEAGFNL